MFGSYQGRYAKDILIQILRIRYNYVSNFLPPSLSPPPSLQSLKSNFMVQLVKKEKQLLLEIIPTIYFSLLKYKLSHFEQIRSI